MRYVSLDDAKPGDIIENEYHARGTVVVLTADDMLLVAWDANSLVSKIHWHSVECVKCRG